MKEKYSIDYFVKKLKENPFLLLILLIAIFLRLFHVSQSSLWTDELATFWIATAKTYPECIARTVTTQGMSPFYFLIECFFFKFLPQNEITLRFLSILTSLVSLILIYLVSMTFFSESASKKRIALFASFFFAIHEIQIYYAQEARPYALAIMLVLLSQFFFLKILKESKKKNYILYSITSSLCCYAHYIFFAQLIFLHNILFILHLFDRKKDKKESHLKIKHWLISILLVFFFCLPNLPQIIAMVTNTEKWTWLHNPGIISATKIFLQFFIPKIILILIIIFAFFTLLIEKIKPIKNIRAFRQFIHLFLWWGLPFLCLIIASLILKTSFYDHRYFLVSLLPFYLAIGWFICSFKNPKLKMIFPLIFFTLYIGMEIVPVLKDTGAFTRRIQHNWRGSLDHLSSHLKTNDIILLRSGFVKENWIPTTKETLIKEYCKAPIYSCYFDSTINYHIYNLTYSFEDEFNDYFNLIYNKSLLGERIWIIGVNPPNTNYPLCNISKLFMSQYKSTKIYEKNFSGVYLCLLKNSTIKTKGNNHNEK